ncbi:PBECR2 nuclease fold domain-containing protein [Rhodospirillum centenum]|uniref:PBECR3 domain-containing polyvalent protein n=1 Tax=Rhodospirillum centenum TaxID=34018 RepID=UPI0011D11D09|nr:PBECR2 nuclease fold domain-containing protein [Rhodospirillum centenum]
MAAVRVGKAETSVRGSDAQMGFDPLDLGKLPSGIVNRTLGTDLDSAPVHMSGLAHRHAAEKHPGDYPLCLPHLRDAVRDPTFIGQAPKHRDNIELIRRIPGGGGSGVLVAVSVETDAAGRYRVRSFYVVSQEEIDRKRAKGHVRLALK